MNLHKLEGLANSNNDHQKKIAFKAPLENMLYVFVVVLLVVCLHKLRTNGIALTGEELTLSVAIAVLVGILLAWFKHLGNSQKNDNDC